jgi:Flp pilus assembly protein TadG
MKCLRPTGQNLVELTLVLPFAFVLMFATFELGQFWRTVETVKLVATDGVTLAAKHHDMADAIQTMKDRLTQANIPYDANKITVSVNSTTTAYTANVEAEYRPLFSGLNIRLLGSNPVRLIPGTVPIRYQQVKAVSFY